jgi:uncharacterized protein (TIGR00299 family) protein
MRIAFFDIVSGISGDMTLGACIGAGVPFEQLTAELRKLPLEGYRIERREVVRSMISAVKVDVIVHVHEHACPPESAEGGRRREHEHEYEHVHENEHVDEPGGGARQCAVFEREHEKHRGYLEIKHIIDASSLSDRVKQTAQSMFLNLARAEAAVHNTTIEQVHFHEVGAVDSIVDIVGTAICMDILGVERVYSSPVRTGSGGVIRTQHGMMPVPAPATVELLKGYPMELTDIPHELTTPTGATIITTLSAGVLDRGTPMRIEAVGYGAGTKEFAGLPNTLRLVIAEIDMDARDERLTLLETNIDDMNPELYPYVLERLLEAGARDAWLTPVLMKKGRPAHVLSVLADASSQDVLTGILMNETSTTGVRMQTIMRRKLPREIARIETSYGEVAVKVITRGGGLTYVPEFEECRRIAQERNLPLIEVYKRIESDLREYASRSASTSGNRT